jgi:hypothetical protein
MDDGALMEPVAMTSLMSRLQYCYKITGIDVTQRTFRGYGDTHFLAATPDGVLRTDDGDFLIEIKCPSSQCPAEPRAGHVIQVMLQMFLFRFMYQPERRVHKALLYYWTPSDTRLFQITFKASVMDLLFEELRSFRDSVINNKYESKFAEKKEKILEELKKVIV